MKDLPPEAKELLARVRAEQPRSTAATRARVRAGVADALAEAQPPAPDKLEDAVLSGGEKAARQAPVLKLAALAVLVGITGSLSLLVARPNAPVSPQGPAAEATARAAERGPVPTSAQP